MIGWAVACGLLLAGVVVIGDLGRGAALLEWAGRPTFAMVVWLVFWPLACTVFPRVHRWIPAHPWTFAARMRRHG
ncbi:UNVERIFIED_ORG: hypothetical protein FHR35_003180 [Microbispora rosea subsp. rosea]